MKLNERGMKMFMRGGVCWRTRRAATELNTFLHGSGPNPICGHVCIDVEKGNEASKCDRSFRQKKKRLPHLIVSKSDTIGDIKAFIADRAGIPPDRQSLTTTCHPRKGEGTRTQFNTTMSDNDLVSMCSEVTLLPWFKIDCRVVYVEGVNPAIDDGSPRRKLPKLSALVPGEAEAAADGSPQRKWARLSPAVPAEAEAAGGGDNDLAEAAGDGGPTPLQLKLLGRGEELLQQQQQGGTDAEAHTRLQLQLLGHLGEPTPEEQEQLLGCGEGILYLLLQHQQRQQVDNDLATDDGGIPRRKSPRLSPAVGTAR